MAAPTAAEVKAQVKTSFTDATVVGIINDLDRQLTEHVGPRSGVGYKLDLEPYLATVLALPRPAATITTAVEYTDSGSDPTKTTLQGDDYELNATADELRRLSSGTNARSTWGWHVELTYDPVDDEVRRNQVLIQLCRLEINYRSSTAESVGDFSRSLADYERERTRLMRRLIYRGVS
jgi:hypothetical protein